MSSCKLSVAITASSKLLTDTTKENNHQTHYSVGVKTKRRK